jgi:GrpB-like predicted nucleotidyltransferase (UPF0157 family)
MPIAVVEHDPEWSSRFARKRAALEKILAAWLRDGVHHIGSTAVPGLAAKPIIDMMAGVRDLAEAAPAIAVLAEHGYVHAPHRPRTYWFYRTAPHSTEHTIHLHLTEPGSDLWRERLAFRDALRRDANLRREYQDLKRRLAESHDDVDAYTANKRDFVARVLAADGIILTARSIDTWSILPDRTMPTE